jgi:phosphatidylserine decarboxylase
MRLHKEGTNIIIVTLIILASLLLVVHLIFPDITVFHMLLYAGCLVLLVLMLRFFRAPGRGLSEGEEEVLSSADGVIVAIEEVEEPEFFGDKRKQVSVFMSVNNVHINWYPVSGNICYFKYHPGAKMIAHHPKSSTENERTSVVIDDHKGHKILVRQVAGIMARRIVYYAKEGMEVKQGGEMGFIKFGSRVDIFLPLDATVLVHLGDKVRGRISAIAWLK